MVNEEVLKIVLNDKTFGRDQAADIVGGLSRLMKLISNVLKKKRKHAGGFIWKHAKLKY